MERYFEINQEGHNIRCKLYYDKNVEIKKVFLCLHGFAGHKDNQSTAKFAERLLTKYKGIAVLTFDWPCHGKDVKKKMVLADCNTYLRLVVSYIQGELGVLDIYGYGTSFGGYMILKYIKEEANPFVKIGLRCPAIDIYQSLMEVIMSGEDKENLSRGRSVMVGFDRKVEVNPQFMEDLHQADVRLYEYFDEADDMVIIQGTADDVISYDVVQQFADDNVIEFVSVEGADHRFQNPKHMEVATKAVLALL